MGVPCLTLRPNAARPVIITHGTNRLVARRPRRGGRDGPGRRPGRHMARATALGRPSSAVRPVRGLWPPLARLKSAVHQP